MTDSIRLDRNQVAVLIPALNESLRIREVVLGALAECPNVIVVDDGSDDGTHDCIADLPVIVLRHAQRMGKGASLRDGFDEARRRGFSGVLTMDGDGQHSAADIPRLLDAANRHPGCIVIGARLRKRAQQPTYRRLANDFGDWGIAWALGYQIADTLEALMRPHGVAVFMRAKHMCVEMRGVREISPATRTTVFRGVYADDPTLRAEFLNVCGIIK